MAVLQFLERLSDRQSVDAGRARIDCNYALNPELMTPDFGHSVLGEFRARRVAGGREPLLLDRLLARLAERGLVKARDLSAPTARTCSRRRALDPLAACAAA